MKCLNCGTEVDGSMQFCPECGTMIVKMFCGNCGRPCTSGDVFCAYCGSPVGGNQQPARPAGAQQQIRPAGAQQQVRQTGQQPDSSLPAGSPNKKKILIGVGAALAAVFALAIGIHFYRVKAAHDKAAEYQEVYDGLEDRFATYIIEDEDEKTFSDYKQDLADAIGDVDIAKCEETAESIDSFEENIRDSSKETISQMQSDLESADDALFYSAELGEWKEAVAKGDKLAKQEDYRKAKGAYDTCMDILDSAKQSESYSMTLSQVDVTDFPKVKLYLSIRDRATDEAVEDLEKSGFVIREKIGNTKSFRERKVEKAAQMDENEGLNTAIVADVSASMGSDLYTAEQAMANFVQSMQYNVNDRAALYSFADDVYREQYFTKDKDVLQNAIYNLNMGNMTALYDALVYSISDAVVEDGAKCVIAFTDGMENNSHSTKDYVISKAKQYDIPIYIIGIGSGVDTYDLQEIANQTGGFYRGISSIASMETIYKEIYAAQKALYVLQYTTQKKKKAKLLREIYIRYSDDAYNIRTEETYTPATYKIDNFIFYDSDSRYLKEKELASLSEEEVLIALNEIYARRGYQFSTNEFLIDHFGKCSWYKGKYKDQIKVSRRFNKYEKANVKLLVQYEKKHQLNNRK